MCLTPRPGRLHDRAADQARTCEFSRIRLYNSECMRNRLRYRPFLIWQLISSTQICEPRVLTMILRLIRSFSVSITGICAHSGLKTSRFLSHRGRVLGNLSAAEAVLIFGLLDMQQIRTVNVIMRIRLHAVEGHPWHGQG